jgi:hypothetical protein
MQRNSQTKRKEIARFVVPPAHGENRFAGTSFQVLDEKHAERKTAPEYINIRHRVLDPVAPGKIEDLNNPMERISEYGSRRARARLHSGMVICCLTKSRKPPMSVRS